jgi:hypothetical protein
MQWNFVMMRNFGRHSLRPPTLSNWLTACAPAFSPACRRIPDLDVARFIHSFHIYLLVRLKMYRDLFWSIEKPSPDLA